MRAGEGEQLIESDRLHVVSLSGVVDWSGLAGFDKLRGSGGVTAVSMFLLLCGTTCRIVPHDAE